MTKVMRGASAYSYYYYALFDENGNEICRVVPGLHEPECDCRSRAESAAVWLDAGTKAHFASALECVERVRAKAENACNGQPD